MIKNAIGKPDAKSMKRKIAGALLMSLSLCLIAGRIDPPPPPPTKCVEDTDGQIPFTVRRAGGQIEGNFFWVEQDGFGGRYSKEVTREDITTNPCTFYRIKKTIISHTGRWKAILSTRSGTRTAVTEFDVNADTNRVDITATGAISPGKDRLDVSVYGVKRTAEASAETATEGVNTVQQSQALSPRELAAEAWLGDTKDASGTPDSDRWFFSGNAGDSLIVRLEPDNKGGNNKGQAILRFMGPPTKQVSGKLPLRIDIDQLRSTGRYDIEIEQAVVQGEERYKGGYTLTIESAEGTIHGLRPTDSVEK
jgi:hypothetical protein